LARIAALGERTDRAPIGTSVLTPTFRYHPAVVAQAIATLGCLYPARVVLGVGTGEALNEVARSERRGPTPRIRETQGGNQDYPAALERGPRHIRRPVLQDRPSDDLRSAAATGPDLHRSFLPRGRSTRRPVGQGFICTSGKDPGLYTDTLLPALREGAERADRDLAEIDVTLRD
jgi:coenzyme F420-dependent glucose-6-phosphate dehydrogenase